MARLAIHGEIRLGELLRHAAALWLEKLGEALSWAMPQHLREKTIEVDIEDHGDSLALKPAMEGEQVTAQHFAFAASTASDIAAYLAALKLSHKVDRLALVLRVPLSEILRKRFTLPNAAQVNLLEAAKYQIDLITPFQSKDVYFDVVIADATNSIRDGIPLELVVVVKGKLESLLLKLQQYVGQIDRVSYRGEAEGIRPINLLQMTRKAGRPRGALTTGILAGIIGAGLVWGLVAPLFFQSERSLSLVEELAKARSIAKPLLAEYQAIEKRVASEQSALKLDRQSADPLAILAELTKILPDDTWLVRFSLRAGEIQITGMTPSTSKIMDLIATSRLFEAPSYVSPVVKDPQSGLERFVFNIHLRKPA